MAEDNLQTNSADSVQPPVQGPVQSPNLGQTPMQAPGAPTAPVAGNTEKKATIGMVLGIISLLAWLLPIVGLPVSIVGLVFSLKGKNSAKKSQATAGMVLSIIGLVLTIINAAAGAYIGVTGQL